MPCASMSILSAPDSMRWRLGDPSGLTVSAGMRGWETVWPTAARLPDHAESLFIRGCDAGAELELPDGRAHIDEFRAAERGRAVAPRYNVIPLGSSGSTCRLFRAVPPLGLQFFHEGRAQHCCPCRLHEKDASAGFFPTAGTVAFYLLPSSTLGSGFLGLRRALRSTFFLLNRQ